MMSIMSVVGIVCFMAVAFVRCGNVTISVGRLIVSCIPCWLGRQRCLCGFLLRLQ